MGASFSLLTLSPDEIPAFQEAIRSAEPTVTRRPSLQSADGRVWTFEWLLQASEDAAEMIAWREALGSPLNSLSDAASYVLATQVGVRFVGLRLVSLDEFARIREVMIRASSGAPASLDESRLLALPAAVQALPYTLTGLGEAIFSQLWMMPSGFSSESAGTYISSENALRIMMELHDSDALRAVRGGSAMVFDPDAGPIAPLPPSPAPADDGVTDDATGVASGGSAAAESAEEDDVEEGEEEGSKKWMVYAGIGGAVLVLMVALFAMSGRQ